jgi:hypothetical protein
MPEISNIQKSAVMDRSDYTAESYILGGMSACSQRKVQVNSDLLPRISFPDGSSICFRQDQ